MNRPTAQPGPSQPLAFGPSQRWRELWSSWRQAGWRRPVGYAGFTLGAFLLCLIWSFPYDALRSRLVSELGAIGWEVTIGNLGPGLFWITATDVKIRPIGLDPSTPPTGEPLVLPRITARPALFPLGVSIRVKAFGGTLRIGVGGVTDLSIHASADQLDPSAGSFKAFSGLDLSGRISGELSIHLPVRAEEGSLGRVPDPSAANGSFKLTGQQLLLRGGTVNVPLYGQLTPIDLPRVSLGEIEVRSKIDKGLATLDLARAKGDDLELLASGTLRLARRWDLSEPNITLKLKAEPEFLKRLGLVASGLSMLPPDRENPAFRSARLTGFLGHPALGPSP